jgi:hypothetical protein
LAYCTDAVLEAAEDQQDAATGRAPKNASATAAEPLSREELKKYLAKNAARLKEAAANKSAVQTKLAVPVAEIADGLEVIATIVDTSGRLDLEDLERRLTVLDEKLQALLTSHAPEDLLLKIRREMDGQLASYRRKMKAEQLAMVEKQYLQRRLLEEFGLPRLSLFYLS